MPLNELSGKYKIGDTIVVNVDDRSVFVNSQPVYLRYQVFSALLLLMEQRLHEAAVLDDDFSKTLTKDKQQRGDVVSNESIRAIVRELNKKLQPRLIVRVPRIGYKLDAEISSTEPRNSVIPPAAISEFSQIAEKLNSVIDNMPELIEQTIALAFSREIADNANDLLNNTVFPSTEIKDDTWSDSQTSPAVPLAPVSLQSESGNAYKIGDIVLRHWKIVRRISSGSYSTVCEAHRTVHDVICKSAIKIIHSSARSVPIVETDSSGDALIFTSFVLIFELEKLALILLVMAVVQTNNPMIVTIMPANDMSNSYFFRISLNFSMTVFLPLCIDFFCYEQF